MPRDPGVINRAANMIRLLTTAGLQPYGQPVYDEDNNVIAHVNPLTRETVPYRGSAIYGAGEQLLSAMGLQNIGERLVGRPRAPRLQKHKKGRQMRGIVK